MKKSKNLKKPKKPMARLLFLVFLVLSLVAVFFIYAHFQEVMRDIDTYSNTDQNKINKDCRWTRRIDGMCVEKDETNLWPVTIMIDNHPGAWPQYGISQAQLVYNTLVEGGATRIMAVFATPDEIKKIGPVRSSRPYFLTWAKELNALYGHSGGSPDALAKIEKWNIHNLEEITSYGPLYFYRDYQRTAPHNLFTSSNKLNQAKIDWELSDETPKYTAWQFSQNNFTTTDEEAEKISIAYSTLGVFDVYYKYNTSTEKYLRWQNDEPYIDALDYEQITTTNLIVQFVPEEEHLDSADRLAIETLGTGDAWIFFKGQWIKGSWQKEFLNSRTIFFDDTNEQITFPAGNIWVEVVPDGRGVEVE